MRQELKWVKFDRYEIREGFIRPAPGASLIRSDLAADMQTKKALGNEPRPHEELANIDLNSDDALLIWVHKYGLLGLLPHRLEFVQFSPQVQWLRSADSWQLRGIRKGHTFPATSPMAILATWHGDNKEIRFDLDGVFRDYFPDCHSLDELPLPYTPDFWRQYAETTADFRAFASTLRETLDGYRRYKEDPGAGNHARRWLKANGTLSLDTPFDRSDREAILKSRSLINTMATLIWMDWGQGKTIGLCSCGNMFATRLSKKEHCSEGCRKREEQKERRRRKKEGAQ